MPLFPVHPTLSDHSIRFSMHELSAAAFQAPFFDEGIRSFFQKPNHAFTEFDLDACYEIKKTIPLRGLIFHISHCGSTLLAQALAAEESHRVISEAELINTVFLAKVFHKSSDETCIDRLRKAVNLLTQPLPGKEEAAFIKFSSWNIFHADLIVRAFPGTPIIYIHRNPNEVISSLLNHPNGFAQWNQHTVPILASYYLNQKQESIKQMRHEEYLAYMLLLHMQHAVASLPESTTGLNFPDWLNSFPENIFSASPRLTVIRQKMIERLNFDSKKPIEKFQLKTKIKSDLLLSRDLQVELNNQQQAVLSRFFIPA